MHVNRLNKVLVGGMHIFIGLVDIGFDLIKLLPLIYNQVLHVLLDSDSILHFSFDLIDLLFFKLNHSFIV